ncbi:MAG: hypothetical protein ACP5LW_05770 [Nitrososphaeria archaeon]
MHDLISDIILAYALYPDDPVGAFVSAVVHDGVDKFTTEVKKHERGHARK